MNAGNKFLKVLFGQCFPKFNPDDPATANKIEEISDKILDAGEMSAKILSKAAIVSFGAVVHIPSPIVVATTATADDIIHRGREKLDAKIGNEGIMVSGASLDFVDITPAA